MNINIKHRQSTDQHQSSNLLEALERRCAGIAVGRIPPDPAGRKARGAGHARIDSSECKLSIGAAYQQGGPGAARGYQHGDHFGLHDYVEAIRMPGVIPIWNHRVIILRVIMTGKDRGIADKICQ